MEIRLTLYVLSCNSHLVVRLKSFILQNKRLPAVASLPSLVALSSVVLTAASMVAALSLPDVRPITVKVAAEEAVALSASSPSRARHDVQLCTVRGMLLYWLHAKIHVEMGG